MSKVHCIGSMTPGTIAAIVDPLCPGRPSDTRVCCNTTCPDGGGDGNGGVCPTPMKRIFCFCDSVVPAADNGRCPGPDDNVAFFAQTIVDGECVIPEPKPDAEKLLKVHSSIDVLKAVEVKSSEPIAGDFVPGKKVLVAGYLKLGFQYSSCTPDQKVHFFDCEIPFETLVFKADGHLLPMDFDLSKYIVHVCVEQLQVQQTGCRTFSKVAIILVWLEPR